MNYLNKQYTIHLNKIITFIFTILFVISFIVVRGLTSITIYAAIVLFVLNIINCFTSNKISSFFEILIYEAIAILGIYFINWVYVLVFILVAEPLRYFKNKLISATVIILNSTLYLLIYFELTNSYIIRGFKLWEVLLLLFLSMIVTIYFITSKSNDIEKENYESTITNMQKEYQELMQEYENMLILKELMDISNTNQDLNHMIVNIDELLLKSFKSVDYATIFLFDDNQNTLKIVSSNVPVEYQRPLCNLNQFDDFEDVMDNTYGKVISSEIGLRYPTASQRNISSAFCVCLQTQKSLIGMLLLESKNTQAFKQIDLNKFNLIRHNISLIIENKRWISKIEKQALVDGLTGAYNRNYLLEFLERQLKWHKENNKTLSLVMVDIDSFKKINDSYGHLYGDFILKQVCKLIKDSIREVDLVARYGGEEFIIVMVDTNKSTAQERLEKIRLKVQNHDMTNEEGVSTNVTVSFGIAEFNEISYNITIEELIERTDKALCKAKQEGKNCVITFDHDEVGI